MSNEFDVLKAESRFDFQGVIFHNRKRLSIKGEIASRLMEHFAIRSLLIYFGLAMTSAPCRN